MMNEDNLQPCFLVFAVFPLQVQDAQAVKHHNQHQKRVLALIMLGSVHALFTHRMRQDPKAHKDKTPNAGHDRGRTTPEGSVIHTGVSRVCRRKAPYGCVEGMSTIRVC